MHSNQSLNVPFLYEYLLEKDAIFLCHEQASNKPTLGVHKTCNQNNWQLWPFPVYDWHLHPAPLLSTMMCCPVPKPSLFESYNKIKWQFVGASMSVFYIWYSSQPSGGPICSLVNTLLFLTRNQNGSQDALPSSPFFHLLLHDWRLLKVCLEEVGLQVQHICPWQQFFITPPLRCCDRQEEGRIVASVLHCCGGLILF